MSVDRLLTKAQVCDYLGGIHRTTLDRMLRDPKCSLKVTCYLNGKAPRISESALQRFVESQPSTRTYS